MTTAAVAYPLPEPLPVAQPAPAPVPWLAQVMLDTVGRTGARLGVIWIGIIAFFAVFAPFLASSHPYFLKTDDPLLVRQYGRVSSPLLHHLTGSDVSLLILAVAALFLWFNRALRTPQKIALLAIMVLTVVPLAHWKPLLDYFSESIHDRRAGSLKTREFLSMILTMALLMLDGSLVVLLFGLALVPSRAKIICAAILGVLALVLVILPVNPPILTNYAQYREAEAEGHVQYVLRAPLPFSASDRLRDQFSPDRPHPWAPSLRHPFGTESYGADVLSRMMHASRIAMSIGFIATGIAVLIGAVIGGLMGYFVGWVDLAGMRLVEIFAAIPTLYLLLAFVAVFDRNLYMMMVIIGLTTWVGDARFVRAEFLRLRDQDFVHAARAAGLPLRTILFRHMLPNAMAPLLVSASFGIASAILYESILSFLGLGLVDEPSWGQLLNQAVSAGGFHWWLAMFPGMAIFLTVFAYNLIGEAVRDALDPKLRGVN